MDDIKIHVPAIPIAQPRPRAVSVAGRSMIVSNPAKHPVTAYKATCRLAAAEVYSGPPLTGPLALSILCVLPRPANRVWKTRPMPREPHDKRPDFDNLAKACTDALTGLIWKDDSQLYEVRVVKVIASFDEQPHVEIVVWRP
jgi:Holliday junction resolvase RusA-like endonuclease